MNNFLKIFIALTLFAVVSAIYFITIPINDKKQSVWKNSETFPSVEQSFFQQTYSDKTNSQADSVKDFISPIDDASKRVTKKPFGIFITSESSPVQPENFYGYHTGVDFEIFEAEKDKDVNIFFICDGEILEKRFASGYGGVLVQLCKDKDNFVTVVYGHLNIKSISKSIGDDALGGEKLGLLGEGFSLETDGERKHLHLGIHKGSEINIAGYVQNEAELSDWIDPCILVCGK